MKSFYMTLPSNASMKTYPNNTLSHYYTTLPKRVRLEGEWECGLVEVHYTRSWYNMTDGHVDVFITDDDNRFVGFPIALEPQVIDDVADLVKKLNAKRAIDWRFRNDYPYEFVLEEDRVKIKLQPKTNSLNVFVPSSASTSVTSSIRGRGQRPSRPYFLQTSRVDSPVSTFTRTS